MKKNAIFIIIILLIIIYIWQPEYIPGREFLIDPYAYKGKTITLVLISKKPVEKYMLFSADFEQPVRIRFENENKFDFSDRNKFYIVTFLCKNGSIYHGNYIKKVISYYEQKKK